MHHYSMYYLLAINALSFLLYGIDKYKAKKNQWRISEATLLMMAVIGGSIGAWAGMRLWHHKTMHKKFKYGIPVIIILQVVLAVYLHTIL
ncbi:MAG: DUF1294 domain-containing protein [Prevotella sp.]|nr:DUF1294 domain-containing protein [Prevotella sp.]